MALVPFPSATPGRPDPEDPRRPADRDDFDAEGAKMSFLEHLDELRTRLVYSVIAVAVGCVVSFIFLDEVFDFVTLPMRQLLPAGSSLITTEPSEYFILYLKVGVLMGFFVASPFVMWQIWLFIAPGLYAHEKRFAIPFVALTTFFLMAGATFSHYVAFPWTWNFFIEFTADYVQPMLKLGPAFSLYVKMLLGFAIVFQMPTVVFFLSRMGLITSQFLIRNFKYAVLIIFILGAVLSPGGDIVSQSLMAGPMLVLYGISIGIAWAFAKSRTDDQE